MICTFSGYCTYLAALCLYLSTVGGVFAAFYKISSGLIFAVFALSGLACMFCSGWKGWRRFLPMVLTLAAFLQAPSIAAMVLAVPPVMLLGFHVLRRSWTGSSGLITDSFRLGFGLYIAALILTLITSHFKAFESSSVPYFVMWLLFCTLTLRAVRNEETGKTGPLFYALNTGIVLSIAAAGYAVSSPAFLGAVKSVLALLYEHIIGPILMLCAYIAMVIPLFLGWVFSFIELKDPEPLENVEQEMSFSDQLKELMEESGQDPVEISQTLKTAGIAVAVLLFLVICFFILRKMVDYASRREYKTASMARERTAAEAPERKKKHRSESGAAEAVRSCYRKYLRLCRDLLIPVDGAIASDEILRRSEEDTGPQQSSSLRRLWLPVRYGSQAELAQITEEDARNAKQALRRIRDYSREREKTLRRNAKETK